ncbi:MAG: glycosyltransferase family 9 protein [Acidobacteria bacterium]|nr:MAG: glycosyltransferase family 9 protein [Acidobacteriota bacterium]
MLGPSLRALRNRFPDARITLLASPAGARAAPLLACIDDVITHRATWQDASGALPLDPTREIGLVETLRGGAFDAAFIFTSFSQSPWPPAFACYLAGIPRRVGQARDFGGSLLTVRATPPPDCTHQVDRNLHLLQAIGVAVGDRDLAVAPPAEAEASADRALRRLGIAPGEPFVLVAPGASCTARRYSPSRFAQAITRLGRAVRMPIVLTGSPREATLVETIRVRARSACVRSLGGDSSVVELAAIVARARLLVGNNSGPMHLADACRCPMVILYSGTDLEEQWQPRRAPATLLRRPTPCEPCYRFECPYHMECLDIPASEVADACLDMLERTAHRARVPARIGAASSAPGS